MPRHTSSFPLTRRRLLAGAAATTSVLAAPALVRAQGAALTWLTASSRISDCRSFS